MTSPIPVVDLFAGPGGLNEGFHSRPAFETVGAVEMESNACDTLRFRSALRENRNSEGRFHDDYYAFLRGELTRAQLEATEWMAKCREVTAHRVLQHELAPETRTVSDARIAQWLEGAGSGAGERWVLTGGPPCQAYSLVGRARRRNDATFADDRKHFLYEEYLHILRTFRPAVFVMENVKGLLSSRHGDRLMFERIMADLQHEGDYTVHSLVVERAEGLLPTDFVIRGEEYGLPQRRHRVILLGVRHDQKGRPGLLEPSSPATVREVIGGLPPVRSTISPARQDDDRTWRAVRAAALPGTLGRPPARGGAFVAGSDDSGMPATLRSWLVSEELGGVAAQHESRGHMTEDLMRYAAYARAAAHEGRSPTLRTMPSALLPRHRNVSRDNAPFVDRFRVQVWDRPSSTIVSHLSKDGHAFIHPDPRQMRSLTVREAARLQTFPDDYWFEGPRTKQFQQVGNAVPPFLAGQIADVVARIFDDVPTPLR